MHRFLWALGLAFITACTSGPEKTEPDADGEYDFEGICRQGTGNVSVTGQWAGIADLAVGMEARRGSLVALCPNPQEQPAELLMRIHLTEGESGTTQVELQLCDLQLPTIFAAVASCPTDPSKILELSIFPSDALAAFLPTLQIFFDSGIPTEVGAGTAFRPDIFVELVGAALDDPTDPLPFWDVSREGCTGSDKGTAEECVEGYERLADDDGDGQLGVTLGASSGTNQLIAGEAYVTIRLSPQLDGTVKNEHCIEGNIALNLDFTIVDSDVNVSGLKLNTPTLNDNIPPLDFLEKSRFKLLRADGPDVPFDDDGDGVITCAEIRNNRGHFLR
ncbi:MAG: hypothetical protein GXY23_14535 [Myxococcales bacterium]|nr:hypothetical protein [Myxococcales bacterium]